jgi:hypothetical protein
MLLEQRRGAAGAGEKRCCWSRREGVLLKQRRGATGALKRGKCSIELIQDATSTVRCVA